MKLPFVISIPHCSQQLPPDIASTMALDQSGVREAADVGAEEIFASLPAVKVLAAKWSRLVVDLNRAHAERGEKGIIATKDYCGRSIFLPGQEPGPGEVERRVGQYYRPFHRGLSAALERSGVRGLLDCHTLDGVGPSNAPDAGQARVDVVLGNNGGPQGGPSPLRGGITCPPGTLLLLARAFREQGLRVALNQPYAGGFVTRHYGQALMARESLAVQVEINKDLFWDGPAREFRPDKLAVVRAQVKKALIGFAGRI